MITDRKIKKKTILYGEIIHQIMAAINKLTGLEEQKMDVKKKIIKTVTDSMKETQNEVLVRVIKIQALKELMEESALIMSDETVERKIEYMRKEIEVRTTTLKILEKTILQNFKQITEIYDAEQQINKVDLKIRDKVSSESEN